MRRPELGQLLAALLDSNLFPLGAPGCADLGIRTEQGPALQHLWLTGKPVTRRSKTPPWGWCGPP